MKLKLILPEALATDNKEPASSSEKKTKESKPSRRSATPKANFNDQRNSRNKTSSTPSPKNNGIYFKI